MSSHPGLLPDGSLDPGYDRRIQQNNSPDPAAFSAARSLDPRPPQASPYGYAPQQPGYPPVVAQQQQQPYPTTAYAAQVPAQHYQYPYPPQQPQQQQPYPPHHQQQQQQPYPPNVQPQPPQHPYPPQQQQQQQHSYPTYQPSASYAPAAAPPPPGPRRPGYGAVPPPPPQHIVPAGVAGAMTSSFRPSGRKKALLVGINYKGTSAALRGCVRDVTFVHHLLVSKFGFKNRDFVVLTDQESGISGVRKGQPTRKTIIDSLRWLVEGSRSGDSLWFSFSGHGSQVRDKNGDESDGYDETILPVDYKRAGQIIDDDLYAIVRRVARGSRLTVLLDACHSGTGLDLPYQHDVFGTGSGQRVQGSGKGQSLTSGLFNVAGALLNGNASGALSAGLNLAGKKKKKQQVRPDPNAGEVLLFAGCKDDQTSADTSKLAGGLTTGAMTYALIETLEHSTVGDWRNYTYRKLLHTMRQKLRANRMTQVPQFSTSHPFDLNSKFML